VIKLFSEDFVKRRLLTFKKLKDSTEQLAQANPIQPYLLVLQDPADMYNDLGRKHYAIKHSQRTMQILESDLLSKLKRNIGGTVIGGFVGTAVALYRIRRKRLHDWGTQLLAQRTQPSDQSIELSPLADESGAQSDGTTEKYSVSQTQNVVNETEVVHEKAML
jgi:hypothetical protein